MWQLTFIDAENATENLTQSFGAGILMTKILNRAATIVFLCVYRTVFFRNT
jgi:hypothetical protein